MVKAFEVILAGKNIGTFRMGTGHKGKEGYKARAGYRVPKANDITRDVVPQTFKRTAQETVAWLIAMAIKHEKVVVDRVDTTNLRVREAQVVQRAAAAPKYTLSQPLYELVTAAVFGEIVETMPETTPETTPATVDGEPVAKPKKKK